jgi:predicted anti-sigma-YlaC factor YlaD
VDHASVSELLGVYALDACDDVETALIEGHLEECDECRDEAERLKNLAGWMGVSEATMPSEHLRSRIIGVAESEHPQVG